MTNHIYKKHNQELIIVRGHPGSGKTTFAKNFEQIGYAHFENDSFFVDKDGKYEFKFEFHQVAKDTCLQNVINALMAGKSVVVSNNYTKLAEMDDLIDFVTEMKIPYRVFEMEYNFENVHNVPETVVQDKKKHFEPHPYAELIG